MKKNKTGKLSKDNKVRWGMTISCAGVFIVVFFCCILGGIHYVNQQLLLSNENSVTDLAEMVKSSFQITDEEVAYMKSLSFNEMEVDPINRRLMDIGDDVILRANVVNVYIVAPLLPEEVKYTTNETNAENFECEPGTPLNAVWLLNGIIGEDGKFKATQRDDIYRYTDITEELENGFNNQESFGTYSSDEWGEFITGYVPIYSTEGSYVGMLGIDVSPDAYQKSVESLVFAFVLIGSILVLVLIILTSLLYMKYTKIAEAKVYFDFYSKMSHDMRTPMNGIIGMVHLSRTEDDPEELHRDFEKVGESGNYLLQLINDTLDISKISSGKMQLYKEAVSMNSVLNNITDMICVSAKDKNVQFTEQRLGINDEVYVWMDALRFKQILMNVLSNAVKFTPEGGTVSLIAENEGIHGDVIHFGFRIVDNGIGMENEFIKKSLFRPFSQEHNTMGELEGGTGLGMAIVKNLVELMNGQLKVESKLGEGTTFFIDLQLPVANQLEGKAQISLIKPEETKLEILEGKHILLCEDHPLNAQIAARLLENVGCIVETAANGRVGLEMFCNSPEDYYDAVLMDIRMPEMDGLSAARAIRGTNRKDTGKIPIVAMTANAYAEDVRQSYQAGMNAHLSKPVEPKIMYATLIHILEEKNE